MEDAVAATPLRSSSKGRLMEAGEELSAKPLMSATTLGCVLRKKSQRAETTDHKVNKARASINMRGTHWRISSCNCSSAAADGPSNGRAARDTEKSDARSAKHMAVLALAVPCARMIRVCY